MGTRTRVAILVCLLLVPVGGAIVLLTAGTALAPFGWLIVGIGLLFAGLNLVLAERMRR